jgi:hypothetical protein
VTEEKKIVLQKDAAWYDRGYGNGEGPVGLLVEAGAMIGMAGFYVAMLALSHAVGLYERLRRR